MTSSETLGRIAREASSLFTEGYNAAKEITYKGSVDLVTQYDLQVELLLKEKLSEAFPEYTLIGEETAREVTHPEKAIYIDPIDGTTNFVHGIPFCAISIGLFEAGRPAAAVVYLPILGELYSAEAGRGAFLNGERIRVSGETVLERCLMATGFPYTKVEQGGDYEWVLGTMRTLLPCTRDIRRLGSASVDLCYVARGTFEGFYEVNLKPWDVAAGWLIVEEAGGKVSKEDGSAYGLGERIIVATNGKIHKTLIEKLPAL
jgi:myo-inositol-1(or 4)-monophosphatase